MAASARAPRCLAGIAARSGIGQRRPVYPFFSARTGSGHGDGCPAAVRNTTITPVSYGHAGATSGSKRVAFSRSTSRGSIDPFRPFADHRRRACHANHEVVWRPRCGWLVSRRPSRGLDAQQRSGALYRRERVEDFGADRSAPRTRDLEYVSMSAAAATCFARARTARRSRCGTARNAGPSTSIWAPIDTDASWPPTRAADLRARPPTATPTATHSPSGENGASPRPLARASTKPVRACGEDAPLSHSASAGDRACCPRWR